MNQSQGSFRFDGFLLDCGDRRLLHEDEPVALNARYLDALILLVREQGRLVPKERFLAEVWRGVPVTDEALTQCIRTLRRRLGDDVASPRFVETVPKHGYRFVAPVVAVDDESRSPPATASPPRESWQDLLLIGGAGTAGAGLAGLVGGLFYGLAGASQPLPAGMGALSVLLVLTCVTILVALAGGAGVAFGIVATGFAAARRSPWVIVGGAVGGFVIGAFVKLLGLDAFQLLVGRSLGDITGAAEGALLGGAVGLGSWLAGRSAEPLPIRRAIALAGLSGGAGGLLVPILGGRLMGGSLDLLGRIVPGSRLRLDPIGALLGENGFGPVTRLVTGGLEGALFGGCIVGAMILAQHRLAAAG